MNQSACSIPAAVLSQKCSVASSRGAILKPYGSGRVAARDSHSPQGSTLSAANGISHCPLSHHRPVRSSGGWGGKAANASKNLSLPSVVRNHLFSRTHASRSRCSHVSVSASLASAQLYKISCSCSEPTSSSSKPYPKSSHRRGDGKVTILGFKWNLPWLLSL